MRVMIGVCGSIAAYKAAELVRQLQQRGIGVSVAMTRSATRFVTPLTFEALTGRTVHTHIWSRSKEGPEDRIDPIEHVTTGQDLDALVLAPTTANMLAKLANGIADDFITATYLVTRAPILIAPAMNCNMWQHPATQKNVRLLKERGAHILEPESGYLACGMTGGGRLASVEAIADAVLSLAGQQTDLANETILITAGGTKEPIDPVRYIGNRSSGRMGYALADEALRRAAQVILVSASSLPAPHGCRFERVSTAAEMRRAVLANLPASTILIKAAAVADFRLPDPPSSKIRRNGSLTLALAPTEDIVVEAVANRPNGTTIIAFAAETEDLEVNARHKLLRKGVDAIVANYVNRPGLAFDSERNAGMFITKEESVELPESSKQEMAKLILDEVKALRLRVTASG